MAVLGGFANFFGPIIGALAFTLLQDQLQSLTAILALRARRHPGADRHRLSGRDCRARRRSAAATRRGEPRMTPLLETRNVSKVLRRLPRARGRQHDGARRRTRLGRRPERRRQDHAGQSAHRAAGADRGRSPVHGREHRRHRPGRAGRARPGARVPAHPDFPQADRGGDHRGGGGFAAEKALAPVLAGWPATDEIDARVDEVAEIFGLATGSRRSPPHSRKARRSCSTSPPPSRSTRRSSCSTSRPPASPPPTSTPS